MRRMRFQWEAQGWTLRGAVPKLPTCQHVASTIYRTGSRAVPFQAFFKTIQAESKHTAPNRGIPKLLCAGKGHYAPVFFFSSHSRYGRWNIASFPALRRTR